MPVIINASTSTGLVQSADTSGIIQFQSNGSTKATLSSSGFSYPGAVLQVVSTTKTDTFAGSVQTNTWTDITGMSVSITPTSASSKILVLVSLIGGSYNGIEKAPWRLMRDSTPICVGNAAGNRGQASGDSGSDNQYWSTYNGNTFLDSPSTTSSITYKCQYVTSNAGVFYLNRTAADRDTSASVDARTASTITVMEIAA